MKKYGKELDSYIAQASKTVGGGDLQAYYEKSAQLLEISSNARKAAPKPDLAAAKAKRRQRGHRRQCISCLFEAHNSSQAAYHERHGCKSTFFGWDYWDKRNCCYGKKVTDLPPVYNRGKPFYSAGGLRSLE